MYYTPREVLETEMESGKVMSNPPFEKIKKLRPSEALTTGEDGESGNASRDSWTLVRLFGRRTSSPQFFKTSNQNRNNMKPNVYKNWRIDALLLMAALVFVLMVSESGNWLVFASTKVAGVALMVAAFRLGKRWKSSGRLPELDDIEE